MKFKCPDCGQEMDLRVLPDSTMYAMCHWATAFKTSAFYEDHKVKRQIYKARDTFEVAMKARGHNPREAYWGNIIEGRDPYDLKTLEIQLRCLYLFRVLGDTLKKQKSKEPWLRMPEEAFEPEQDDWVWKDKDYVPNDPERS